MVAKGVRKTVGWMVAQGFIRSGIRARAVRRYDQPGTCLSLCAHDPTPEVLQRLIRWLKARGFQFVSEDALLSGALPTGRLAWLTFDDGWRGFRSVLGILEREEVPASLFIAPGESRRGFLWTNALLSKVPMARVRALYRVAREAREEAVAQILGPPQAQTRTLLSPEEISALAAHPLLTIGNHTCSHLSISHRTFAEAVAEIEEAQALLRDWTGRAPRCVCYPFGHRTAEVDRWLRAQGLQPVGLLPGVDRVGESLGRFRNMIYDEMSLAENACRIVKAWLPIRKT